MRQDAFTNIKSLSFLRKCNVVWVNVCSNVCGEGDVSVSTGYVWGTQY